MNILGEGLGRVDNSESAQKRRIAPYKSDQQQDDQQDCDLLMNILGQGLDLVVIGVEMMQGVVEGTHFVRQRHNLVVGEVQCVQVSVTVHCTFTLQ